MIWANFMQLSNHMWDDEMTKDGMLGWYSKSRYVETNDTDLDIWDENIRFSAEKKCNLILIDVGDAIQYETHPEISAPDAWSKDFMKKKLDEIRALGLEPIPKLNFSAGHDTWLKEYRRMISTPQYYKVCADLIGEVCELFGSPRLFHLGLDEEVHYNQVRQEMIVVRNPELWWHDVKFLFGEVEKRGARPWIWADDFWHHPDLFAERMPRSVLLSNWFYYDFKDYPVDSLNYKRCTAYEKLNNLGFEQVPCLSTWSISDNPRQMMLHCKKHLDPKLLAGYLTVAWHRTERKYRYLLLNDLDQFYMARELVYPETL